MVRTEGWGEPWKHIGEVSHLCRAAKSRVSKGGKKRIYLKVQLGKRGHDMWRDNNQDQLR